jgi:hypothetical protein
VSQAILELMRSQVIVVNNGFQWETIVGNHLRQTDMDGPSGALRSRKMVKNT